MEAPSGIATVAALPLAALAALSAAAATASASLERVDDQSVLESKDVAAVDRVKAKQAFSALVMLYVEAARTDADAAALSSLLEDCRISGPKAEAIVGAFSKIKSQARLALRSASSSLPHLADVSWRLDFLLKSNVVEKIHEAVYTMDLQLENGGRGETVQFACTAAQLQDLVAKLKDAVKSLENAAS